MSEEYTQSREVGKQVGKICYNIINFTSNYFDIAYKSVSAGFESFLKEAEPAVKNFSKKNQDLNSCVDEELKKRT